MIVYPSVTVLIPNYNDEEYIEKSIRSALEQDYEGSLNVCVVDDGCIIRLLASPIFAK